MGSLAGPGLHHGGAAGAAANLCFLSVQSKLHGHGQRCGEGCGDCGAERLRVLGGQPDCRGEGQRGGHSAAAAVRDWGGGDLQYPWDDHDQPPTEPHDATPGGHLCGASDGVERPEHRSPEPCAGGAASQRDVHSVRSKGLERDDVCVHECTEGLPELQLDGRGHLRDMAEHQRDASAGHGELRGCGVRAVDPLQHWVRGLRLGTAVQPSRGAVCESRGSDPSHERQHHGAGCAVLSAGLGLVRDDCERVVPRVPHLGLRVLCLPALLDVLREGVLAAGVHPIHVRAVDAGGCDERGVLPDPEHDQAAGGVEGGGDDVRGLGWVEAIGEHAEATVQPRPGVRGAERRGLRGNH
eukprot:RCo026500